MKKINQIKILVALASLLILVTAGSMFWGAALIILSAYAQGWIQ